VDEACIHRDNEVKGLQTAGGFEPGGGRETLDKLRVEEGFVGGIHLEAVELDVRDGEDFAPVIEVGAAETIIALGL